MKKSLLFVCAAVMMVFTACEDVPAPYTIHSEGGSTIFNESFASSLGKFTTKSASGDLSWYSDYSSAVVTGYKDFDGDGKKENKAGETYLVSPFIHLENIDSAYISFSQAINYEKSTIKEDHKLLVSADYANNVATATWTELPISFNGVGGSFTFVDQEVQIPSEFMGKSIVVALKHIAHDSYSSTWEVKNFKVLKGKANESTDNPDIPDPTDENVLPYTSSSLKDGFTVVTEKGTAWSLGNSYAKATGYDSGSKTTTPSVSWLVSPAINTTKAEGNDEAVVVDFDYVLRYVGAGTDITAFHKLYASTDFTGDVTAATWTDLGFEAVESATQDWTFYAAPTLTLPAALVGQAKVYFAFRFECNAENSTTWELKNFKVHQGGKTEPTPDPEPSGDNLIANGTFESWSSGEPVYWKSASTASSATLSQSNESHSGSYSVEVEGTSASNKRLAYKEITLKAGTYNFKFYAKAATSAGGSVRPGYAIVEDGKINSSNGYKYGDYVNNLTTGEWTEVNHSFTLSGETTLCLVVMNPKNPGANVLIDDVELTTSDGGLATGDDNGGGDNGGGDNGGGDTGDAIPYSITFTSSTEGWTINDIDLGGLNFVWKQDKTYGMKASAFYNSQNNAAESDFISPEFTIPTAGATLSINHALNFLKGHERADFVAVQVICGETTEDLALSTWPAGTDYTYVDATASLAKYAGKTIKIVFHYKSSEDCAPTWEIKTLNIQ